MFLIVGGEGSSNRNASRDESVEAGDKSVEAGDESIEAGEKTQQSCYNGDQYPHMLFISEYQICTNSHVLRNICEDDIILLAPFVRIWRHNTGLE